MGLQDRDYMHERRERDDRMVWPQRSEASWTRAFIFGAALLALYFGAVWLDKQMRERQREFPMHSAAPPVRSPSPHLAQPTPQPVAAPRPQGEVRIAVKCVELDGRTSYVASHDECAARARRTEVTVAPTMNVADGMSPQQRALALRVAEQPVANAAPQQVVALPSPNAHPSPGNRSVCAALDEQVRVLDQYARQPLSAWEQDRIGAERKNARDTQFRLHCQ